MTESGMWLANDETGRRQGNCAASTYSVTADVGRFLSCVKILIPTTRRAEDSKATPSALQVSAWKPVTFAISLAIEY